MPTAITPTHPESDLEECETTRADRTHMRRLAMTEIEPGAPWNDVELGMLLRRSIRRFKGHQVPAHMIRRLLEVARFAPSQGNCQPWSFVVVRDKNMIADMEASSVATCRDMTAKIDYTSQPQHSVKRWLIKTFTRFLNRRDPNMFHPVPVTAMRLIAQGRFAVFHKAPTLILILKDSRGVGSPDVDIGIVGTNIVLAAQSYGLGTCWVGFSKLLASNKHLCKKLGIEPPFEICEAISIGYPVGNPGQHMVARQTHEISWWENGTCQILY